MSTGISYVLTTGTLLILSCGIAIFTMTYPQVDNSGTGQLQVPGFGDIPVDYELKPGERLCSWRPARPQISQRSSNPFN